MQYIRNGAANISKQITDTLDHLQEYITRNVDVFSNDECEYYAKFVKETIMELDKFSEHNETKPLGGIQLLDRTNEFVLDIDEGYFERLSEMSEMNGKSIIDYMKFVVQDHLIGNHDMLKVHYKMWKQKNDPDVEWTPPTKS